MKVDWSRATALHRRVCAKLLVPSLLLSFVLSAPSEVQAGSKLKRYIAPAIGAAIAIGVAKSLEKKQKTQSQSRAPARQRPYAARSPQVLSQGDLVRAQTSLAMLGLYQRAVDGKDGPGTRAAVAQFQVESGYAPTGILSRDQYAELTELTRTAGTRAPSHPQTPPPADYGERQNPVASRSPAPAYAAQQPIPVQQPDPAQQDVAVPAELATAATSATTPAAAGQSPAQAQENLPVLIPPE